ncbi:hypothetical protein CN13_00685 [Petrotoga sp. HKA.pet.4.5]|uniref:hypothetical protein n=1 Tax=unclassified Petrotoga TaxID=2620614 RepID=UPI000EF14F3F|nr:MULTISPECIES: hypothetical protein [unclassified Petrotoga]RLL83312.1 hypothetical protein BZ25_07620 [Petrotoga sp. Shatin.DS.tank11.9.2.9.3]RLL90658.1 hypothetical protein CN13_00685 [Petrotoga sp. HKA.pet.4.5]
MINTLFKSFLFLLSYLPLFVIFAINNFGNVLFLFFSVFSIVVFVGSLILFISAKTNAEEKFIKFEKVESQNVRLLDYIFVYILPFINMGGIKELISFAIIVFIVGNIYVKTDLIAINPVLSLFGYSIYKVCLMDGREKSIRSAWLISKSITEGMKVKEFSKDIYLGMAGKK